MPVKNLNHFSNQSYDGRITGLTEDEKKAIDASGLLDNAASKLIYDNGLILLDKFGNVIEGQDDPVTFSDKFNVESNLVDINTYDTDLLNVTIEDVSSIAITMNASGSGTTLTSIKLGDTLYTIPYSNYVTISDFNTFKNTAVTTNTAQTISGAKTFSNPIKVDEIDNSNGNAMVRYKSSEAKNVFGGVNYDNVLMGKSDRPYYSKDGSDFVGVEIALKSDSDAKQDALVSGTNIKTINNESILGSGNITIEGGGGSSLPDDPTTDGTYALVNNVSNGSGTQSWSDVEGVDMVELPAVDTSTDGTYVLKATVSSGAVTYSWVKE